MAAPPAEQKMRDAGEHEVAQSLLANCLETGSERRASRVSALPGGRRAAGRVLASLTYCSAQNRALSV